MKILKNLYEKIFQPPLLVYFVGDIDQKTIKTYKNSLVDETVYWKLWKLKPAQIKRRKQTTSCKECDCKGGNNVADLLVQ